MSQPPLPKYLDPVWGPTLDNYLLALLERIELLEARTAATVGPAGPPGTGVNVMPEYTGLQMVFGPEPLPPPESLPNRVYVVLPPRIG